MVTEYLIRKKEELITRQVEVESLLNNVNSNIRESEKMIELLDSENRPAFSDFSPRDTKNDKRVNELKDEIEEYNEKKAKLKIRLENLESQIIELNLIIDEARELEKEHESRIAAENAKEFSNQEDGPKEEEPEIAAEMDIVTRDNETESSTDKNNETITEFTINDTTDSKVDNTVDTKRDVTADENVFLLRDAVQVQLEKITGFLPSDPMRSKIELLQLIKKLKNI